MSIKRRLFSLVAATAVATTTGVALVGVGAASADTVTGQLKMNPGTGSTLTAPSFTTPTGQICPAGTTDVQMIVTGGTLTEDTPGVLASPTAVNQVTAANKLNVPAGVTLGTMFADVGIVTINGDYTVHVQCLDSNAQEVRRFNVTATYTSTGSGSATYVAANPAESTSAVLSGPATSVAGSNVAFTTAVTPAGATGAVQFKDGGVNLGSPVAVSGGTATYNTSSLTAGAHSITADFVGTGSFGSSTSNTLVHTVSTVDTTTTLVSNGPSTDQGQSAIFTATVSPAVAGSVAFTEGATTLATVPVTAGTAVFSTTGLAPGAHVVTATFTPANPGQVNGSASQPVTHNVALLPNVVTETITVDVPAGALTMVLDDGQDGQVHLGTAQFDPAGEKLTAEGDMDPVKVLDTRAGDPGWTVTGVVNNFSNGTDQVNGFNLGWTPAVVSLSANQQAAFVIGGAVAAGTEGTPGSTPANSAVGLKSARTLGTAPNDSGNGTARLTSHLNLNIPTDVSAGTYAATLTLTVVGN